MAVLKKEEFFTRLHTKLGEDTSDDSIAFLEDMTDTYNELENRANGNGEDWEKKYHDLDETWKKRYRHRFFSGASGNYDPREDKDPNEYDPESVSVDDLFK